MTAAAAAGMPGDGPAAHSQVRQNVRTPYMAARARRLVSTRQEITRRACPASGPPAAPTIAVPRAGEKLSDEELHARFGVPVWGGIRVSREKKCIVLVGLAANSNYDDAGHGRVVSYMGQNSDREGTLNQEMPDGDLSRGPSKTEPADPGERRMQAASNNLSLSRSKMAGYTVLYFTKERGAGDPGFVSLVECDSHDFEVEQRAGRPPRVVVRFRLRRVDGVPGAAAGMTGPAADRRGALADGADAATGGAPPWGDGNSPKGVPSSVGHVAGTQGSAQLAVGRTLHARAPPEAPRRAERPEAVMALSEVHARLELDGRMVGTYMRDAIRRGGYRAALDYYASEESEKFDRPWHRFKARGWLLGRLGRYDQMASWLEGGVGLPDFDLLLSTARSLPHAAYRTPAMWLDTPRPAPLSVGHMMAFEPAAAACRDMAAVPAYIWTAMLILDATGPVCSHAGLGAALSLVEAGAAGLEPGAARGGSRYDPRRGARLHGAPDGCHRWIIADIDFGPRPSNEPHYYYDLTDEGRKILASAGGPGAPWPKATEDAAAGLSGMALPDLLEGACRLTVPARGLDEMRGDLGRLADAWRAQDGGVRAPQVGAEDQVLVDLGLTAGRSDAGETAVSPPDHFLYLTSVVDSTRAVACEAEPSTRDERAVLQTLIAAIQDMCRGHGRAVAAAASAAMPPPDPAPGSSAWQGGGAGWRPPYADATPALISDLYYCLAEYCRSRRLAVDPCSLPLSEALSEDKKAAVAEVLMDDSVFYHGED